MKLRDRLMVAGGCVLWIIAAALAIRCLHLIIKILTEQ